MTNKKITDFTTGPALTGNEFFPIAIGDKNYKYDLNFISTWFSGKPTAYNFGALADDPAVSPFDGGPIPLGAQYYNTTLNAIRAFGDGGWFTPNLDAAIFALATGAQLVGTPEGTVQDALDGRPTSTVLAATDGATLMGVLAPDAGAEARTQADKNADTIHIFEFIPKSQLAAILAGTSVYDATVPIANFFAACTARKKIGAVSGAKINCQKMVFPAGFPGMRGDGTAVTTFQHIPGTAGAFISVATGRLNNVVLEHIRFLGYGTNTEGAGIDLAGFNYTRGWNVWFSGFYGSNAVVTGYVVTAGDDRSCIENKFKDCIFGSSVTGYGIDFVAPGVSYDVAALVDFQCTDCYIVNNAAGQIRVRFGENINIKSAIEGSTGTLLDFDSCNSFGFEGYIESRNTNLYIKPGPDSRNHKVVATRWTYPLWGMVDPTATLGYGRIELAGNAPGRSCFANPDLAKSTSAGLPIGVTTAGVTSTGYVTDSLSNKGASSGFSVASGSGSVALDFKLEGTAAQYFGKRITIRLRSRASGLGTSLQMRPRVATTDTTVNGNYYSRALTFSSAFGDVIADIVFPPKGSFNDSDPAYVRLFFSTFTNALALNVDEFSVYEGGFAYPFGNAVTEPLNASVSLTATLSSLTGWPNVLKKTYGRLITDEQTKKIYIATGSAAASPWREIATGTEITPT